MRFIEKQNRKILDQLEFLRVNMNCDTHHTSFPYHMMPPYQMQPYSWYSNRGSYTPLTPTSTPQRVATRRPLSTLMKPSSNSDATSLLQPAATNASSPTCTVTSPSCTVTLYDQPSHTTTVTTTTASANTDTTTAKENDPPIPIVPLIEPEMVVEKYPKLVKRSKITTLAVRLAKESYFGKRMMYRCTVRGIGEFEALPQEKLMQLKAFVKALAVPRCVSSKVEFENLWKDCTYSIGQACKTIRLNIKAGKPV